MVLGGWTVVGNGDGGRHDACAYSAYGAYVALADRDPLSCTEKTGGGLAGVGLGGL